MKDSFDKEVRSIMRKFDVSKTLVMEYYHVFKTLAKVREYFEKNAKV